jgi:ribosomal protein S27E
MRTITPYYAVRVGDLEPGDFLKVECLKCLHVTMLPPDMLLSQKRVSPATAIKGLERRFKCEGCGTKGVVIVSV